MRPLRYNKETFCCLVISNYIIVDQEKKKVPSFEQQTKGLEKRARRDTTARKSYLEILRARQLEP